MNSVFDKQWRGVLALIWLLIGLGVLWLIERLVDPLFREYFSVMWIIGGWLLPALLLAISGLRNGNVASRICSSLVLLVLAAPVLFIIYAGFSLYGH